MPTDQTRLPLSNRIDKVAPSATLAVDMKAKAMKAQGIDIIGFGVGEPNFATPEAIVEAAAAAVCAMGLAGETAHSRLSRLDGNATYRNYIIDAIYNMTPEQLEEGARYEMR